MQTKQDLEDWYKIPDRWQYFQSEEDKMRKEKFMELLSLGKKQYTNALDIGCGECFIAKDLPSENIFGIELSDTASSRFPSNVTRLHQPRCDTSYDLVVSTGTLYPQYDHKLIYGWILEASSEYILISGIKEWLIEYNYNADIVERIEFKYLNYTQQATLYKLKSY